jgi:hypothetical protein
MVSIRTKQQHQQSRNNSEAKVKSRSILLATKSKEQGEKKRKEKRETGERRRVNPNLWYRMPRHFFAHFDGLFLLLKLRTFP